MAPTDTALMSRAPTASAAPGCGGYFTGGASAYYRHCGPTSVMIHLDTVWAPDRELCVGPESTTYLGKWSDVRNAWYANRTC